MTEEQEIRAKALELAIMRTPPPETLNNVLDIADLFIHYIKNEMEIIHDEEV